MAILTVLLPGLIAFLLPAVGGGHRPGVAECAHRLSQLYRLGTTYSVSHRGKWPNVQGEELWLHLAKTNPPLIDPTQIELLFCPIKGEEAVGDATDYRGPACPEPKVESGDPLGADKPGNHGDGHGGNVLRMDGGVVEGAPDDPVWRRCAEVLRP